MYLYRLFNLIYYTMFFFMFYFNSRSLSLLQRRSAYRVCGRVCGPTTLGSRGY